jgi:hypothetical protein
MGLLPPSQVIKTLDIKMLDTALRALRTAGIGQLSSLAAMTSAGKSKAGLRKALERLSRSLEDSPVPEHEWPSLVPVLGEELLGALLGVSGSSIQRYKTGERPTPDAVAARLHFLTLIIADLAGAYNEIGVRNWFRRTRAQLDGVSPETLLSKEWSPEDEGPDRVRRLAESLVFSPVT